MGVTKRSLSASGTWLIKHVMRIAKKLEASQIDGASKKQILEGYLLIAKKAGDSLSAVVIDLPAWLCLLGRYIQGGGFNQNRHYIQTLAQGRDSYMPGTLRAALPAQDDPATTAGAYRNINLGSSAGQLAATHYWGSAQPFNGVGAMHAFPAIASDQYRWPMAHSHSEEEFFWRLNVIAPTTVRFVNGVVEPSQPAQPVANWSLNIGESVLASSGAIAITRLLDESVENYELSWEGAQYPWISTGKPATFLNDEGEYGYRVSVVAQVVYDAAGPYYWYGYADRQPGEDSGSTGAWVENVNEWTLSRDSVGIPSGARGLWAADIEVVGLTARVVNAYKIFDLSTDRAPLLRDHSSLDPDALPHWYLTNSHYRAPIATINNDDGTRTSVMVGCSIVDQTPDGYFASPAAPLAFKGRLFTDIAWFDNGAVRRQNLTETELKRGKFYPGRAGQTEYAGGQAAYDIGEAHDDRFTIGADTDGTTAVFPVFSSFEPGEWPRLRVYVATRDGVRVGYDGVPGFAWCVARATGEQMVINFGVVDFPDNGDLPSYGDWITYPAPFDHVTYIGNQRYVFYVSHELGSKPQDNHLWGPPGSIAVATYSAATDVVALAGIIDSQLYTPGFGADGDYTAEDAYDYVERAHLNPVFASGPKLGRIEVVRPESEGFNPAAPEDGGHPATLIASEGSGTPGLTLPEFDSNDIRQGRTWISYDSGATWTKILDYGSPSGAIHCGNIAQARSEPVVRV